MMIAAALALSMAAAEASKWNTVYNGWTVRPTKAGSACYAGKEFDNQVHIYIEYDERRDDVMLAIIDPSFQSVNDGQSYTLGTDLELKDGRTAHFGEVSFTGTVGPEIKSVFGHFVGREFLEHFEKAARLKIKRGTISVADIDVSYGEGWQISALRRCAAEVGKVTPSDPFAD